jgi:predicted nucleic acid-binding Zn ribbon protein
MCRRFDPAPAQFRKRPRFRRGFVFLTSNRAGWLMSNVEDGDEDELADSEWPDEADQDSADVEPCPYCRKPVYTDAEVCPHCGSYISHEDAPRRKPMWLVIGVIVCILLIVLVWVL